MTTPQPEPDVPQPRDIAVEMETQEVADTLEANSSPEEPTPS
jgi:hypothetical protein